jgi:transcription-repair coupling factor (superfamily II helicase)
MRRVQVVAGEFIVHAKYGVAQFLGLKMRADKEDPTKKVQYMFLKYADGTATIKASLASRQLYRYQSPALDAENDDDNKKGPRKGPKLNKLKDTSAWEKRLERSKRGIRNNVVAVMEIYMQRMLISRPPYDPVPDQTWDQFEEMFPYSLTPDQASAIDDVASDLSNDTPMDRLIIGDVGFGKTEVAMRSIFRVAQAGRQVCPLTPVQPTLPPTRSPAS